MIRRLWGGEEGDGLTKGCPKGITKGCTNGMTKGVAKGLTKGLTMDSQKDSPEEFQQDTHTEQNKMVCCPVTDRGHGATYVVREKCCFYIGFIRLSAKHVVFTLVLRRLSAKNLKKTCVKSTFFVDNPPGTFSPEEKQRS